MTDTTTTRKHKFHAGQKCRITRGPYAGRLGVIMFDEPIVGCAHGDEWFVEIGGRGMGHEIRERDMKPVEEEAARPVEPEPPPEPAAHHWAAGDRARIDSRSHIHHGFDVILTKRILGEIVKKAYWEYKTIDGFDPELMVYEECLVPAPEPVAHRWAAGDEALIGKETSEGMRWIGQSGKLVGLPEGSKVTLVRLFNIDETGRKSWLFSHPLFGAERVIDEDQLSPVGHSPEPEPSSPPAPQPPTLYRVEYVEADADGDPVARKAALIPVAGVADRLRWAEILEILTGYAGDGHDSDDRFAVVQLGGIPADPYAVGDRVTIVGGEHAGEAFYLIERDEANGQRWWLCRKKDGEGWLGLHVDRFTADERGDE